MSRFLPILFGVVLLPSIVSADVLPEFVGLFNIFVGLMLVAAFLSMGAGLVMWAVRLGTYPTYRDEAIKLMSLSVTILFVLIVLLVVVQFVQKHTAAASFALGLVVFAAVVWFLISIATSKSEEKAEH